MHRRVELIRPVGLFDGLDEKALHTVADGAREQPVSKGEKLFEQGDEATHGYAVGWGQIRLDQVTPDGQNVVLRHMGPGDMIGVVAVLRRIPFPATPVALEDGMVTEAGIEIPFALSRQDLAEMTATTLHTVSRTLSAWDQEGIVESRRSSHLVIRRPHRLVEISGQA